MDCITFCNVTRIYPSAAEPVAALRNVTLSIRFGEFASITGSSGSGKTTFLNLAAGLDRPTQVEIYVRGQNTGLLDDDQMAVFRRRNIGIVFQDCRLLDVLDVKSNLEFALRADGAVPDQAYLMEICSLLGIRHKLDAMPGELSGGERQRAAVARAVAARPALLLADEPTGSLDRKTGLDVLALLRRMNLEFGQTIVMATHSLEAAQMAGRIIHIRDGSVEMPH